MTTENQTAGTNPTDTGTATAVIAPTTLIGGTTPPAAPDAAAAPTPEDQAALDAAKAESDKEAAKGEGAPAEYAEFKAPDGQTLNEDAMKEFAALAKEKNLSQEDAQKLVDLGAKNVQRIQEAQVKQIEQAQAQWAEASHTDKEFGGDKLKENMAVAGKALATFGSPELSTLLQESGLGNHPEIIRAFFRVGKAISEDRLVAGSTKPAGESDLAAKMYPSMKN